MVPAAGPALRRVTGPCRVKAKRKAYVAKAARTPTVRKIRPAIAAARRRPTETPRRPVITAAPAGPDDGSSFDALGGRPVDLEVDLGNGLVLGNPVIVAFAAANAGSDSPQTGAGGYQGKFVTSYLGLTYVYNDQSGKGDYTYAVTLPFMAMCMADTVSFADCGI